MAVISCINSIISNLSVDEDNYEKQVKIIDSSSVTKKEYENKYSKKNIEYTFVIITTDQYEYYLSKSELHNWDSLINSNLKGKKIEVYLRNTNDKSGNLNPAKLIIDGKTIISIKEKIFSGYLMIILTIFCIFYSIRLIKKRLELNNTSS
jgi:hypothetical protein